MKKILLAAAILLPAFLTFAQSGGPDAFGYKWKDNTATGGPNYSWIDISGYGTLVTGLADDNSKGPFNIGFNFKYYWTTPAKFYIGANGYVAFDKDIQISSGTTISFPFIPTADLKDNFVAPFMTDLNFGGAGNPGKCYYWSNNTDSLIISFNEVPFWNQATNYSGDNSFQIIINGADNSVLFQYQNQQGSYDPAYNGRPNPIVIGIENINGQIGLEHSNSSFPLPPYAVLFDYPDTITYTIVDVKPDWLDSDPNGGFFMLRNVQQIFEAGITNVGNSNVGKAFNTNTKVYTSSGGVPTGAPLYNQNFSVSGINSGQSIDFAYGPTYSPANAGTFHAFTQTFLVDDLIEDNDTIESELVVIDTAGQSAVVLSYTDLLYDQVFGFEGAAVKYTPPFHPVDINDIRFALDALDTLTPSNEFIAEIFDDSGPGGTAGNLLFDSTVAAGNATVINTAGQMHVITLPVPVTINSGGFYVSWRITTPPQNTRMVTDITGPFSMRTYEVLSGAIAPYRDAESEDIFIHATVSVPPFNSGAKPVASFGSSTLGACENVNISFYSHATTATSVAWTFPGGTPPTSVSPNPTVAWAASGTYTVQLIATNSNGSDTATDVVTIYDLPAAAFTPSVTTTPVGVPVSFTNSSTNYTSSYWEFGDGNNSGSDNPIHTFNIPGTYTVTLTASNACGDDQATADILVTSVGISDPNSPRMMVFPNPANHELVVVPDTRIDKIEVLDLAGRIVFEAGINQAAFAPYKLPLGGITEGMYLLKVYAGPASAAARFVRLR